jgi:hypothetical protein
MAGGLPPGKVGGLITRGSIVQCIEVRQAIEIILGAVGNGMMGIMMSLGEAGAIMIPIIVGVTTMMILIHGVVRGTVQSHGAIMVIVVMTIMEEEGIMGRVRDAEAMMMTTGIVVTAMSHHQVIITAIMPMVTETHMGHHPRDMVITRLMGIRLTRTKLGTIPKEVINGKIMGTNGEIRAGRAEIIGAIPRDGRGVMCQTHIQRLNKEKFRGIIL